MSDIHVLSSIDWVKHKNAVFPRNPPTLPKISLVSKSSRNRIRLIIFLSIFRKMTFRLGPLEAFQFT